MKPTHGGLIATLVATLMLAACTPTEPDVQPTDTSDRNTSTTGRPAVKDRDEQAVFAALLRIDMCALLKSAASALPGYLQQVRLEPGRPTLCSITSADQAGGVDVSVEEVSSSQRRGMILTSLGGAKTYVERTATCKIYLPVSFTLALAFQIDGFPGENQCPPGEKIVAAAATRLAQPEPVQTEPRWDPCALLRTAIGEANGDYRSGSQVTILDDCAEKNTTASLSFDYGEPGVDTDHVKWTKDVVGSTPVWVWARADACDVEWQAGPPRHQSEGGLRAQTQSPSCEGAKQLAGSVMTLLTQAPPADVPPQRPLLYQPDEPDMPR